MAAAAFAVVGTAMSFIGASKSAKAAKKQAELQNAASERQLAYDTELWEMNADKLQADRDFVSQQVYAQARNEGKLAAFKDAQNAQKYNYDMMIRNREQESLNQQWLRSDQIYHHQMDLNALEARSARADQMRQLKEIKTDATFDMNERIVEEMINEGKIRARGPAGRSKGKAQQVSLFQKGEDFKRIEESVLSATRNTRSVLDEIRRDKAAADLAAYSQKMLDPGTLPEPIKPFKTPMAEFILPREIQPFDFGPMPVLGAMMSPSAASSAAWGAGMAGIASSLGAVAGAIES